MLADLVKPGHNLLILSSPLVPLWDSQGAFPVCLPPLGPSCWDSCRGTDSQTPRADVSHDSRIPCAQGPAPYHQAMPPYAPRLAPIPTTSCWVLDVVSQLVTSWAVPINPSQLNLGLSTISSGTKKAPHSQAGGTASLSTPPEMICGQPSETHRMVYPPLLLQE